MQQILKRQWDDDMKKLILATAISTLFCAGLAHADDVKPADAPAAAPAAAAAEAPAAAAPAHAE